ncbi:hypothetical protein HK102_001061 [Quaeritorhiza haematococci]|nr:hypothetical protein HK102_001061 [Quaeritorhiza haematococci]
MIQHFVENKQTQNCAQDRNNPNGIVQNACQITVPFHSAPAKDQNYTRHLKIQIQLEESEKACHHKADDYTYGKAKSKSQPLLHHK